MHRPPPASGNVVAEAFAKAAERAEIQVWPENWPTFQLFARMSTQWRVGFGGATGLCYEALYPLIDRMNLNPMEWDQVFDDVQEMENAALRAMRPE